jgi:hypothetical protein
VEELKIEQVKIRVLEPSNTRQHISTWIEVISFVTNEVAVAPRKSDCHGRKSS